MNPRVLGQLLDETGCAAVGKPVLTTHAWTQLLGRSLESVATLDDGALEAIESRLVFLRVTACFVVFGDPDTIVSPGQETRESLLRKRKTTASREGGCESAGPFRVWIVDVRSA